MKYLIIDGCFGGTGIRDKYNGGYIEPCELEISKELKSIINDWLANYNSEFFDGYSNKEKVNKLDEEGKRIASKLISEMDEEVKVDYYSDARLNYLSF